MRSCSSPALRQSHSTRRVLLSKSCTEQSQYHQSRTGRCTSHRCRSLWNFRSRCSRTRSCRENTRIRARRRRSHSHLRTNTCLSRWNLERENVDSERVLLERDSVSSQMSTEVRSRRSRFRECTSKTRFRGRRRRSHSHLRLNTCLSRFVLPCGCAACVDDADGADDADGGSALEEAEKGIDRTSHGNSSALGHRYCTGWGTLRNRCTAHMCHHYRASRCSRYCRTSWGCGSADSGCATPEVRNPCSPCPRRSRSIRLPRRRRRKGCRRHSRTCSCIVPACRSAGGGTEGLHERWPRACSDPPSHALRVGRAKISSTAAPQLS